MPVSGAASGIGLAICQALRAAGATPLLLDIEPARLADAARAVHGESADAQRYAYQVDMRDSAAVDACFEQIANAHGQITHAVASAGISGSSQVLTVTDERWHRTMDVNLHGTMYFCRAAARQLVARKAGAIVTIASIAGLGARADAASYVTSKAAVINLTRSLAIDLGPLGIRANAVAPGVIDTPMQERNRHTFERTRETIPLQRVGLAQEVADAALFLLSDRSSYVTGHTLVVDGGIAAKYR